MEAADLVDQIRQRYLDHDRACCTQALTSAAGAVLIVEGFVFDALHNRVWCVFVPPDEVRRLIDQGLVVDRG